MLQTCGVTSSCPHGPPTLDWTQGPLGSSMPAPLAPVSRASGAIFSQGPPLLSLGRPSALVTAGEWALGLSLLGWLPSAPGICLPAGPDKGCAGAGPPPLGLCAQGGWAFEPCLPPPSMPSGSSWISSVWLAHNQDGACTRVPIYLPSPGRPLARTGLQSVSLLPPCPGGLF